MKGNSSRRRPVGNLSVLSPRSLQGVRCCSTFDARAGRLAGRLPARLPGGGSTAHAPGAGPGTSGGAAGDAALERIARLLAARLLRATPALAPARASGALELAAHRDHRYGALQAVGAHPADGAPNLLSATL